MNRPDGVVLALLLWSSCDAPEDRSPSLGADSFVEVGKVELGETADDPIVDIDYVGMRPDGGYLLADRHAGRVRLFDETGRQVRAIGSEGEGPGELLEPTGAVEFMDGHVLVVQGASPRLTIFPPDSAPRVTTLPGQYGFWAARMDDGFVAGVATREERFASFHEDGEPIATFAARDPSISETPFWVFFASEHAAVLGDTIAVNTSLFPTIRLFDFAGDSVGSFGRAPPNWEAVSAPPVSDLSTPGSRERLEEWARSFMVVYQIAAVGDSLLVVQYGRHDPRESDPYFIAPGPADVYSADGHKLAEDVTLPGPVVGGGKELLVLVAEPPHAWTIARLKWRG